MCNSDKEKYLYNTIQSLFNVPYHMVKYLTKPIISMLQYYSSLTTWTFHFIHFSLAFVVNMAYSKQESIFGTKINVLPFIWLYQISSLSSATTSEYDLLMYIIK